MEKSEAEELEYELPGRTDRDAVEYITGYIASESIPFSFQLKLPTRKPREGSFTYLQSRMGGLVRASDETEDQVRRVNEAFNRLHGHGCKLKMGANML